MHDSILEFYFSVDGNKKTLLDLNEYVRNHNDQVGKYRGNMYCIECRKAQLEYVRECIGRRAYLKTKPGQRHERWCSYNYDIANEKYIKKYYNDLTYNQVQNKLLSTLRYIQGITSKVSKSTKKRAVVLTSEDNPLILEKLNEKKRVRKVLRRKSLQGWLDKDELDGKLYLYYGKVYLKRKLKISKTTGHEYYELHVYCKNKKGEVKSKVVIYRGKHKDNVIKGEEYNIVAIGRIHFGWNRKLELINRDAILIKSTYNY